MHPTDTGSTNVPAFLTKLWKLVEDPEYNHLISWSANGKSFIIKNQSTFSKELLPLYFKHSNMASFIRQLNMYGFRKLTPIENSRLKAEKDEVEFYHQYFLKGQESLLEHIKRKVAVPGKTGNGEENQIRGESVKEILTDVQALRERLDTTDSCMISLQQENAALWEEITSLRQKHQSQQRLVQKLIQFLSTIVQNQGTNLYAMKRKAPLMIEGEEIAKRINNSVVGPVIHDVTNDIIDNELEAAANTNPVIITSEQETDETLGFLLPELDNIPAGSATDTTTLAGTTLATAATDPLVAAQEIAGITTCDAGDTAGGEAIPAALTFDSNVTAPELSGTMMIPTSPNGTVLSKEQLNQQVEAVDVELNWLQEQLEQGGVNFDSELADANLTSLIGGEW